MIIVEDSVHDLWQFVADNRGQEKVFNILTF